MDSIENDSERLERHCRYIKENSLFVCICARSVETNDYVYSTDRRRIRFCAFVSRRYLSNISTCKCSQISAYICKNVPYKFLFGNENQQKTRRIIDVPSIHVSFTIAILSNNSAFIAVFRLYPFFIASHAKIATFSSPIFSN